jgi:HSP20 family protein
MPKTEWDPLKELVGVQERMNKLFESALAKTNFDAEGGVGAWAPVTDVYETQDQFILCLELPGLDQKEIDLRMDGDELVVQGERQMEREQPGEQFHRVERSYGKFVRRFPIPSAVDRNSVDALYQMGVLRISIRKKGEGRATPIRVSIR